MRTAQVGSCPWFRTPWSSQSLTRPHTTHGARGPGSQAVVGAVTAACPRPLGCRPPAREGGCSPDSSLDTSREASRLLSIVSMGLGFRSGARKWGEGASGHRGQRKVTGQRRGGPRPLRRPEARLGQGWLLHVPTTPAHPGSSRCTWWRCGRGRDRDGDGGWHVGTRRDDGGAAGPSTVRGGLREQRVCV